MKTLLLFLALALATLSAASPTGFRTRGTDILTPDGKPIRLRGFNVCWWVHPVDSEIDLMKGMGVNCIRYMFGYQPTGKFDPSKIDFVPEQVRSFTSRGIWTVVVIHDFRKDGKGPYDDPELQKEFLDLWTWVIGKLKDDPFVAAWEPVNEPHDSPAKTVSDWYAATIPVFRRLDRNRPIVVEGTGYSWPANLDDSIVQKAKNLIYAFHTYGPWEYTAQPDDKPVEYPGKWSREELAKAIDPAVEFRKKHKVPVWCGEYGVPTKCPGYKQWIEDVNSILEERNLPWNYWAWAHQPEAPLIGAFDVNPLKTEVYELMRSIFAKQVKTP